MDFTETKNALNSFKLRYIYWNTQHFCTSLILDFTPQSLVSIMWGITFCYGTLAAVVLLYLDSLVAALNCMNLIIPIGSNFCTSWNHIELSENKDDLFMFPGNHQSFYFCYLFQHKSAMSLFHFHLKYAWRGWEKVIR